MIAFILIALKPDFTPKQLNGYFHLFIAASNEWGSHAIATSINIYITAGIAPNIFLARRTKVESLEASGDDTGYAFFETCRLYQVYSNDKRWCKRGVDYAFFMFLNPTTSDRSGPLPRTIAT